MAMTLARIDHVLHLDVLIRLVGEGQDARAIGDAVVQLADAVDVFLIVGAGRHDHGGRLVQHGLDGAATALDHRRVVARSWSG